MLGFRDGGMLRDGMGGHWVWVNGWWGVRDGMGGQWVFGLSGGVLEI